MTDQFSVSKLNVNFGDSGLVTPILDPSTIPKNHTLAQIIKHLDNPKNTLLLKTAREFFEKTKNQSKEKFPLQEKLLKAAENTVSIISAKETEKKFILFARPKETNFNKICHLRTSG